MPREPRTQPGQRRRPHLYLVKRAPRPEWHRAPYHPVIVCDLRDMAEWEAGGSRNRAWVWEARREKEPYGIHGGWLLVRWEGLVVDYGHIVAGFALPDDTRAGFHHPTSAPATWALLQGAAWWSDHPLPESLAKRGVVDVTDEHSRATIRAFMSHREMDRKRRSA